MRRERKFFAVEPDFFRARCLVGEESRCPAVRTSAAARRHAPGAGLSPVPQTRREFRDAPTRAVRRWAGRRDAVFEFESAVSDHGLEKFPDFFGGGDFVVIGIS